MVQSNVFDVQESLLRHYWQVVRKRWWMICVVFSLIVITVLIDTVRTRPLYQATMRLLIERENSDIISFDEAVGRKPVIDPAVSYSSYYQTQYEILQSRSLVRRVIRTLQLQSHPEFTSAQETPGITQTLKGLPSSLLGTLLRWLPQPGSPENGNTTSATAGSAKPDPEAALVDSVLARLHIKPIPDTRLVEVSFTAHNPELAADVANMLTRIYIDQNLEMRFSASQGAVDWLNRRVQEMRQKVEEAELALQRYKEANDIVSLEARQTVVVQQLAELNSAHTAAKTEFIGVETLYKGMQRFSEHPEMIESIPSVVNNSLIQSLKENHATLQQTAAELEQRWGPKHPGMIQLRSQMATMQRKIRKEVLNVVRGIETDHEIAQSRIAALRNAFEQKKQEAQRLNQKAIQYGVLKREAESNQQLYEVLLTSMKKTGISAELKRNNIRVIDAAEVPNGPIAPRPVSNLMRAGLVGLILGIGLAFFLESLDHTIKTPEEAEKLLQLPIIGVVGRFKVKKVAGKGSGDSLITVRHPRSQAAEAFKTLRANLLMSYSETPRKVFLITSPYPKDGKTTVAANLAVAMAQMERRVLLVDADLRNPTLHRLFGIDHNAGLSTLLLQEAYEENMVQQVWRDTLSLVPAGPCPPNPSEMLGSERMQRFIEVARESYDTVILDTPPIFAVSDALVASSLVDGIIVVLRSGSTPRKHARRILAPFSDLLIRQPVTRDRKDQAASMNKVLGVVMNFLEPHQGSYYYDYRYYKHNRTEAEDATETAGVADPVAASSVTEHF